jgi:hypothetical protein
MQCLLLDPKDTAITDINLMYAMLIKPSLPRDTKLIISLFSHTMTSPRVLQILSKANSSTNLLVVMLELMSMLDVSSIMKDHMLLLLTILQLSLVIKKKLSEEPREF